MSLQLRWKTPAFAAIVVLSNVLGNLFLKWGMGQANEITSSPLSFIRAIFNPWVSLGICLLIVWLLSKMFLLSWADLSFVLPVTAFGYVLTTVFSRLFLGEHISAARWAGTFLIAAGSILVGLGTPHTGKST
jgi:uncharacterized membrane protein